jgi:spore coat polysaccharide biosynthesis protein SpsF (cytidylyltransferase family)
MRDLTVTTIIQARMTSRRLPGKALINVGGKTILEHVIHQVEQAEHAGVIRVATSTHPTDDPIANHCHNLGVLCYRGSLDDVLDRYWHAAHAMHPIIARVTADCPLLNPELLDKVITTLQNTQADYCTTSGWAPGHGQEAFTRHALHTAWKHATTPYDREHVVPWMIEHPAFRTAVVVNDGDPGEPCTLDTPEDLERLRPLLEANT